MIQYIVNQMWCVEGWLGFDKETDDGLKEAEQRLKNLEGESRIPGGLLLCADA